MNNYIKDSIQKSKKGMLKYKKVELLGIILVFSLFLTLPVQAQIIINPSPSPSHSLLKYNAQQGDSKVYEIASAHITNISYLQGDFRNAINEGLVYNIIQGITFKFTITNVNDSGIFIQDIMTIPGQRSFNSGIYKFFTTYEYSLPLSLSDLLFFFPIIPVSTNKSTMLNFFEFQIPVKPGSPSIQYNNPSSDVIITPTSIILNFTSSFNYSSNEPMKQITSYDLRTGWLISSNITFGSPGITSSIFINQTAGKNVSEVQNLAIQFINVEAPIIILGIIVILNIKKRKFRELQEYNNQNITFKTFIKDKFTKKLHSKPQPKIHAEKIIQQVEDILEENKIEE